MAAPLVGMMANASLYVGDLEKNVNEAQLFDLFNVVAPVVSVRVCRDQARHTSLGYAYVNFSYPHEAAIAREKLNFTLVNGKAIRIMFSHRDPSMRKSGFANIFIKNLDAAIDNKALFETFTSFGNILSCKVATDVTGQSKGHGFVQFDNDYSAQKAIQQLDGILLNSKKVYVGLFIRRHERNMDKGSRKFTNIYVKNFLESTTDEDLKKMFGKFGAITSAVVMKDSDGRSRCFGFVNFENTAAAADAVNGLNGISLTEGKVFYVARAQRKAEREAELRAKFEQERQSRFEKLQGANLYLRNLDESINEESVKELFAEFGVITSCKILRNPQGVSNGVGFVAFSTTDEAVKAMSSMNGKLVGRKPLYVSVAQRKEERRAQLQAQFAQMQGPFPMPRFYYGQGMPPQHGLLPPLYVGYGYQSPFMPGMYPSVSPSFVFPPERAQHGHRLAPRRGSNSQQPQQQWMLRNNNQGGRYMANGQHTVSPPIMSQGSTDPVLPMSFDGQGTSMDNQHPGQLPISSLASETLENQHDVGRTAFSACATTRT